MTLLKTPISVNEMLATGVSVILGAILISAFVGLIITYVIHKVKRTQDKTKIVESDKFYSAVEANMGKIIGGVSILLFALATGNSYIQFTSLFIGGLLIASEKFLVHLAGIFKAKGDRIPDLVNSYGIEPLSESERRQKIDNEIQESTSDQDDGDEATLLEGSQQSQASDEPVDQGLQNTDAEKASKPVKKIEMSLELYRKSEDLVINRVIQNLSYNEHLQKYVKINTSPTEFITPDAVVLERKTNKIVSAIEVKFFKIQRPVRSFRAVAEEFASTLNETDFNAVMFIVLSDYNYEKVNELLEMREMLRNKYPKFGLVIYQLQSSSIITKLEKINDEDLTLTKMSDPFDLGW